MANKNLFINQYRDLKCLHIKTFGNDKYIFVNFQRYKFQTM